jgi:hypothetical protein
LQGEPQGPTNRALIFDVLEKDLGNPVRETPADLRLQLGIQYAMIAGTFIDDVAPIIANEILFALIPGDEALRISAKLPGLIGRILGRKPHLVVEVGDQVWRIAGKQLDDVGSMLASQGLVKDPSDLAQVATAFEKFILQQKDDLVRKGLTAIKPPWVKDARSFMGWMQNLQEIYEGYHYVPTKQQLDEMIIEANKYQVYMMQSAKGHPRTPWDVPHINFGKKGQAHVPTPPGYQPPIPLPQQ